MGNLNKVLLIGRIGQDIELRNTPSGHKVANVSLATSEHFKDQGGNKQEKTEWHRLVFWNKQAEIVQKYCRKGTQLYVEGTLQTREWQDKDGNKRYSTDIVVRNLQLLDPNPNAGKSGGGYQQQGGNQQGNSQNGNYQNASPPKNNFDMPPSYGDPGNSDFPPEDDIPF